MSFNETQIARWVLFEIQAVEDPVQTAASPVVWTGFGLATGNSQAYAGALLDASRLLVEQAAAPARVNARLEEAVAVHPGALTAACDLLHWLRVQGEGVLGEGLAAAAVRQEALLWETPVRFEGGIELAGLLVEPSRAAPGETVKLTYAWRYPPGADLNALAVFAHLGAKHPVVQDDHVLLEAVDPHQREGGLPNEIFMEERTVALPGDAPAGTYDLALGLYLRSSGRRLKPRTDRPVHDRAVVLPGLLEIARESE